MSKGDVETIMTLWKVKAEEMAYNLTTHPVMVDTPACCQTSHSPDCGINARILHEH